MFSMTVYLGQVSNIYLTSGFSYLSLKSFLIIYQLINFFRPFFQIHTCRSVVLCFYSIQETLSQVAALVIIDEGCDFF